MTIALTQSLTDIDSAHLMFSAYGRSKRSYWHWIVLPVKIKYPALNKPQHFKGGVFQGKRDETNVLILEPPTHPLDSYPEKSIMPRLFQLASVNAERA